MSPPNLDKSQTNLKARLTDLLSDLNPNTSKSSLKPSTWEERLNPTHSTNDYSNLAKTFNQSSSILEPEESLEIVNGNQDLALLTIASGVKGELMLVHNVFKQGDEYFGLVGSSDQGNLTQLSPSRLFNNNSRGGDGITKAPSADDISNYLLSLKEDGTIKTLDEILDQSDQVLVKNSIILTPDQATLILSLGELNSTELESKALKVILEKDEQEMSQRPSERENVARNDEDENQDASPTPVVETLKYPSLNENIVLLQTLNAWKAAGKKEAGARISQNKEASTTQKLLNNSLRTEKSAPPSPPQIQANHLTFTGGTTEVTPPRTSTGPNVDPTHNPFGHTAPVGTNSITQIQPTQMASILLSLTQSIESLQNNNASRNKICADITKKMILNLSTPDGINPAATLEPFANDITRAKVSEADLLVESQLNKEGVICLAHPQLSKALSTGNLASLDSSNFFSSLYISPISHRIIEEYDAVHQLREERESGHQLNESERDKLNTNSFNPAKTIQCLLLKLEAMSALTKGYCGEESQAYRFFAGLTNWIDSNKATLDLRTKTHDSLLPTRIESHFVGVWNQYLLSAKHRVPDDSVLEWLNTMWGIANGTVKPDISQTITDALNGKNKKRKRNDSSGGSSSNKKGRETYTLVRNTEQVRELIVSQEVFREAIHPRNKDGPTHNNTQECLKFHLRGVCNKECERASTHNKLSKTRIENLKKFKKEAIEKYEKNEPKD